jgi:hypothetical protein
MNRNPPLCEGTPQNETLCLLLIPRLAEKAPELEELLRKMEAHSGIENGVYRFYHQSRKVYG